MTDTVTLIDRTHLNIENLFGFKSVNEATMQKYPNYSLENSSLTSIGGKNFFRYLKRFNLSKESNLLILPPNKHFFYDKNELKDVSTLINLRKLNLIKDLDTFLKSLILVLPPYTNFVGCFSDNKTNGSYYFISEWLTKFNNFIDLKTDHNLDKKDITRLLEKWGFSVVDMTEINGLTYFYSQFDNQSVKIRA
jgi:hypothetical protein